MDRKIISVAQLVIGMGCVLAGKKGPGLGLFTKGAFELEKLYRKNHPELEPGLKPRWRNAVAFYEETHQEETNRLLHRIGIPIIVGGTLGLLLARPYKKVWWASAIAFAGGWATNIVGHGIYERNRPAFTDDPLSFIAGPAWDVKQFLARRSAQIEAQESVVMDANL